MNCLLVKQLPALWSIGGQGGGAPGVGDWVYALLKSDTWHTC